MSSYPPELVTRALLTVAKHGGNAEAAHRDLAEQLPDEPVPDPSTLRTWRRDTHQAQYADLHAKYQAEIEANLTPEFRDLAQAAAQAANEAVDATLTALRNGNLKDPAGAARNLTITAATAMDKLYLATDRPTEVRTDNDARALLGELRSLLGGEQGETEEIMDAEVITPPALSSPSTPE